MAALIARDLRVAVRMRGAWREVVRDLSITLDRGQINALVGETGSGKTMAALSLIRLLPPATRLAGGQIMLGDLDITALSEARMNRVRGQRISMIFQDPLAALNPVKTVAFQITEPIVVHFRRTRRQALLRAGELLEQVGLMDVDGTLRKYPHELSGGMRQRVLIAQALACEPEVLLADEPTTALDVSVQAQILRLIRDLANERGIAVLFVTHDLGAAAQLADRLTVLYAGAIAESGPTRQVLSHPNHPYTKGLIACVPRLDRTVRPMPTLAGNVQGIWEMDRGCRFSPRCPDAMEKCRQLEPALIRVGHDHASACWVHAPPEPTGSLSE